MIGIKRHELRHLIHYHSLLVSNNVLTFTQAGIFFATVIIMEHAFLWGYMSAYPWLHFRLPRRRLSRWPTRPRR